MPGERILETLQRIATAVHRLDVLSEDLRELRTAVGTGWIGLRGSWLTCANGLLGWKQAGMPTAPRCKLISHGSRQRWNGLSYA